MTRVSLPGLALAACLAAFPLAARAQMMPGPMPDRMMPLPGQQMPPPQVPMMSPRVDFYSADPVYTPGDDGGMRAAQQNVRESSHYEALLQSDPSFRQQRMQRECGSITEPALYRNCIDTFGGRTALMGDRP